MKRIAAFGVLLVVGSAPACSVDGGDSRPGRAEPRAVAPSSTSWDGVALRYHEDAPSALSFPVPAAGYRVRATHFNPATPPVKVKHRLWISSDDHDVVQIDVWLNTERLGLNDWFDKYLRFMASPDAEVETSRVGRAGLDAIVVRQRGSDQSPARRYVIFERGDRAVRVTALDDDDPKAAVIFDRVKANIDVLGVP